MASKPATEPAARPEVGEMLMVIHDFVARSSDELSLTKGDRVELIERDDEFGDGWFLGRHLTNGNTGLFPEVYTRPAPKGPSTIPVPPRTSSTQLSSPPAMTPEAPTVVVDQPSQPSEPSQTGHTSVTLPLQGAKAESSAEPGAKSDGPTASATPASTSNTDTPPQDSQVLHETLNVINEHITNLRSPASNSGLRSQADSGSEYSASLHHRMSYIQGEETDEEEDAVHTREEVEAWTPDNVAEFLFTSGVEKQHCEVFRDQEISGEVLLTMDQSSLFIKAFDLGSVGRRLKTWHKIKALQDEVSSQSSSSRPATQNYSGSSRPQTGPHPSRLSTAFTPPAITPASGSGPQPSPTLSDQVGRPSAASVRDLHHSRRHSSTDYHSSGPAASKLTPNGLRTGASAAHKKQSSFDRNWTLGSASSTAPAHLGVQLPGGNSEPDLQDSAVDMDRGYFSGTEMEGRTRNTLRKRESLAHSRKSSYAEEQRVRSATALSRHSRFGSVESYRDSMQPSAAQKYYGVQSMPHRRTASTNTTDSTRGAAASKDGPAPTVTRLDSSRASDRSRGPTPPTKDSDWLSSLVHKPMAKAGGFGIRAISDNLGFDRSKHGNSGESKDGSLPSPAATGSSTPSGGPSIDLETPSTGKSFSLGGTPGAARNKGKKGKKETSAYTRGLLNIGPKEAMVDADYSGWMRKKSSNLMTTWKPRFFVLKGRRLAYYYSEDDDSEKGLIDISYHRVLPADNEKLTGIHASITGAVGGGQGMPSTPPSAGDDDSDPIHKGDDSMFIFKLVPPKAGFARGVHFTKPTVHYFAVPNLKQGRLWMAALMKSTIDRDDTQPITTTYQQKTISLAKAKQMRHRPPALMNLEEAVEDDQSSSTTDQKPATTAAAAATPDGLGLFSDAVSSVDSVSNTTGTNTSTTTTTDMQNL